MHVGLTMFPTDYSIHHRTTLPWRRRREVTVIVVAGGAVIPTSRKSPWPGGAELPKYYYDSYDPFVSLAAAAAVTKPSSLRRGSVLSSSVINPPPRRYRPSTSSSGRFIFGIGRGWNEEEMANHGTAFQPASS